MEWIERFLLALIGGGIALAANFAMRRHHDLAINERLGRIEEAARLTNKRLVVMIELFADAAGEQGHDRRRTDLITRLLNTETEK